MDLYIETCLEDLFLALVNKGSVAKYIYKEKLQKKSDILDKNIREIVGENIHEIKRIFVTNGPGSFMGVRAGIIYAHTLARVMGIDIFVTSSLKFVSNGEKKRTYIDAKSDKSFFWDPVKNEEGLTDWHTPSKFNLQKFLDKPEIYQKMYQKKQGTIKAKYMKEPRIG